MKKVFLVVGIVLGFVFIVASCGDAVDKTKDAVGTAVDKTKDAVETVADKTGEAVEAAGEKVAEAGEKVAEAAGDVKDAVLGNADKGKEVYDTKCMACHMTGVTGAPKLDEKERWATIAKQGLNVVYDHAIKGFTGKQGNMPPKGGFADLTDEQVKDAVAYMLKTAGAM